MHPPTLLLPLSLYLSLTLTISPSTSLAIASAAPPIAAHAKHHIKARGPVIPPEKRQEAPPVGVAEDGIESEREEDGKTYEFDRTWENEFDAGVPATPELAEEGERQGESNEQPAEPELQQQEQREQETPPPPAEDFKPEAPEIKEEEAQKPIAEKKKKPKKSLYTWPILKTDVLDCCPKYAYNCADRKAICVSILRFFPLPLA
ncbi:hypothetical protein DM02DRAFT_33013 [Periconia macrospinosa]|uniref:Uncharacterized protein n=1 Tax=Periconia macrospinosa TaxID=97972 RepID=A0A2V1DKI6_9PLEO|nr:hypothetical protein DM02DRAFT_33013 [Periconia macrospinosa]